ncbi:putative transposase [Saccharothrix tamanrassetensis]|uniref:Putative transposase n=1 Tax=Saccharothrix tamanrassetensis TaxID=1051531 RepID=A0A841CHW9_9PSEU|nr:putative transposase [Saccharothrix tamanrassetensis]
MIRSWSGTPGRVSLAGLLCTRPGERTRLFLRMLVHHRHRRPPVPRSLSEPDYIALLDTAHRRLGAPIVLVWDNLGGHTSARMRALVDQRDWLHVVQLPAYAPDLNPVEAAWSHLKRGLSNLAPLSLTDMLPVLRRRLHRLQRRPDLLDSFLAHTGLTPDTT